MLALAVYFEGAVGPGHDAAHRNRLHSITVRLLPLRSLRSGPKEPIAAQGVSRQLSDDEEGCPTPIARHTKGCLASAGKVVGVTVLTIGLSNSLGARNDGRLRRGGIGRVSLQSLD